jgi:2-phosphoglycerate kinase
MEPKEIQRMMSWYKTEKIKDNEELKVSKHEFIEQIKQYNPKQIQNTPIVEKRYTLWQRIKRVLGMN